MCVDVPILNLICIFPLEVPIQAFPLYVCQLDLATEVFVFLVMVAIAKKAVHTHQTLFQESVAEYAMSVMADHV